MAASLRDLDIKCICSDGTPGDPSDVVEQLDSRGGMHRVHVLCKPGEQVWLEHKEKAQEAWKFLRDEENHPDKKGRLIAHFHLEQYKTDLQFLRANPQVWPDPDGFQIRLHLWAAKSMHSRRELAPLQARLHLFHPEHQVHEKVVAEVLLNLPRGRLVTSRPTTLYQAAAQPLALPPTTTTPTTHTSTAATASTSARAHTTRNATISTNIDAEEARSIPSSSAASSPVTMGQRDNAGRGKRVQFAPSPETDSPEQSGHEDDADSPEQSEHQDDSDEVMSGIEWSPSAVDKEAAQEASGDESAYLEIAVAEDAPQIQESESATQSPPPRQKRKKSTREMPRAARKSAPGPPPPQPYEASSAIDEHRAPEDKTGSENDKRELEMRYAHPRIICDCDVVPHPTRYNSIPCRQCYTPQHNACAKASRDEHDVLHDNHTLNPERCNICFKNGPLPESAENLRIYFDQMRSAVDKISLKALWPAYRCKPFFPSPETGEPYSPTQDPKPSWNDKHHPEPPQSWLHEVRARLWEVMKAASFYRIERHIAENINPLDRSEPNWCRVADGVGELVLWSLHHGPHKHINGRKEMGILLEICGPEQKGAVWEANRHGDGKVRKQWQVPKS